GSYAFASNKITNIIIPNSVTSIGNAAFINNMLATAKISNNINSIPSETFRYNRLTEVTIPNNVTEIQENAFADNSKLTSITLPEINTEGYNFINWIDSENNIHEANSQVSNFAIGYNANLEIIKCTINGVVKGADGVAIAITGDITDNRTLNNNDNYSLTLNYGQSVEITATKDGEVFENATYTINNIKENKNSCDFITVYNLSGTITGTDDVTVTMNGDASDSKTVNSGDTYNFTVKYNQNVELIPSKEGYNFTPEKYTLTDINQNTDSKDFVATIKKYTINGTVNGADGVTVTMSGDVSANKTVDNGDSYSFTVNHGQSVTITATKDEQVFATNKYAFDDVKENKTDCNFTTVYTVSGTVSGADGVVVELSGDVSAKKVLNSGDTYEFTAQYNQSVAVKASKPGYKFEPATYEFNNIKENSANNHFVGTIKQYTISGTVDGADAVTVTMSGDASDSKTVNSGDTYNFTVNHGQNVTITATKEGYTFTKDTYNFSNVIENKTDVNFKAAINTYTISGTVDGADAVTVTMSGDASDSKTVNSGDTYNFTVNHGQNVTITATKEGYTFSKDTYSLSNVTENKTDINFKATIITYTVQFNIKSEGKAVNNCTVKLNGKDYTTNADGLVTINNIKPGDYSYTVTANGYKEQTGDIKVINKDIVKSIVLIKDDKVLSVDLLDSNNYSLYPNPAKDIITLKSNSTISRVTIISISGAVVKVNTDECNEAHINISDIKPGIYILRAQTKDGLIIKRFIKQ
ncbi:MAG: leucine-rich repeat protein, partial [Bacteroidales bacterium]|nr:leucine-rich repeat protein [Bacteroidales bacterium]